MLSQTTLMLNSNRLLFRRWSAVWLTTEKKLVTKLTSHKKAYIGLLSYWRLVIANSVNLFPTVHSVKRKHERQRFTKPDVLLLLTLLPSVWERYCSSGGQLDPVLRNPGITESVQNGGTRPKKIRLHPESKTCNYTANLTFPPCVTLQW